MAQPFITSDGFIGRRNIVDDYFEAAETLYCGDPVTVGVNAKQTWRADADGEAKRSRSRCVGVVYTGPSESVGIEKASSGNKVPIVMHGICKVKVDTSVGAGDILVASNTPGKVTVNNTPTAGQMLGKAMENGSADAVIDMLVTLG